MAGKKDKARLSLQEKKNLHSVYVGNLPSNTTKADMISLFKNIGRPSDIYLKHISSDQELIFGFVRFVEKQTADQAVRELNKVTWRGCQLRVEAPDIEGLNSKSNVKKSFHPKKIPFKTRVKQAEDLLQVWQLKRCVLQQCAGEHANAPGNPMMTDTYANNQDDTNEKWEELLADLEKLQPCVFTAEPTEGEPLYLNQEELEQLVQDCEEVFAKCEKKVHKSDNHQISKQGIKLSPPRSEIKQDSSAESPTQGIFNNLQNQDQTDSNSHRLAWRNKKGKRKGAIYSDASSEGKLQNASESGKKTNSHSDRNSSNSGEELERSNFKSGRNPLKQLVSQNALHSRNTNEGLTFSQQKVISPVNSVTNTCRNARSPIPRITKWETSTGVYTDGNCHNSFLVNRSELDALCDNIDHQRMSRSKVTIEDRMTSNKPPRSEQISPLATGRHAYKNARNPLQSSSYST